MQKILGKMNNDIRMSIKNDFYIQKFESIQPNTVLFESYKKQ